VQIIFWPLLGLMYLFCLGIDIAIFFLAVRLLVTRWHAGWLEGFNDAGKGLVDAITTRVGLLWYRMVHRHLSPRGELLISILVLYLAQFIICVASRWC
jgi:hypothetical protein